MLAQILCKYLYLFFNFGVCQKPLKSLPKHAKYILSIFLSVFSDWIGNLLQIHGICEPLSQPFNNDHTVNRHSFFLIQSTITLSNAHSHSVNVCVILALKCATKGNLNLHKFPIRWYCASTFITSLKVLDTRQLCLFPINH